MSPSSPTRKIRMQLALSAGALAFAAATFGVAAPILWGTAIAQSELDTELYEEVDELVSRHREHGVEALAREVKRRVIARDGHGRVYLLAEAHKEIIEGSWRDWPGPPQGLPGDAETEAGKASEARTLTFDDSPDSSDWVRHREVRMVLRNLPDGRHLAVGHDISEHTRLQRKVQLAAGISLVVALFIGIGGGLAVSRQLLQRVVAMSETVQRILRGQRDERVPTTTPPNEFDELALHFNCLLDENALLLDRMREVTGEVAHDLRTPLARIRVRIESALRSPLDPKSAEAMLHSLQEEIDGILETFNALLHIAQIETQRTRDSMRAIDLCAIARDACELYEPVAEEAGLELIGEFEEAIEVVGDRHLLAQVISNLLENAFKYAGSGTVRLRVGRSSEDSTRVELVVTDQGPGIPVTDRERVLQRFARLDSARSKPGAGLGLSLVDAVVQLHDAELRLLDEAPGLKVSILFKSHSTPP